MTTEPRAFSQYNENVQLAWDSTSLGNLMFCPTKYKYSNLDGYVNHSIDLDFGILFHKAREVYLRAILRGASKAEATLKAVKWTVERTVEYGEDGEAWTFWRGEYRPMWHCKGETKYRNDKGNRAKCPYSHVGRWEEGFGPTTCGECGSNTETQVLWCPEDELKHRYSLVSLVIWWCDDQPEKPDGDGVWPYRFPDGTEAVELPFRIPLPFEYKTFDDEGINVAETYLLCGHLDNLGTHAGQLYIVDAKTTARSLGKGYREGLSPNHQFDTYDLAASIMFPDLDFAGVLIDAASLLKSGANFAVVPLHKTDAMREEWLDDIEHWIKEAERYADTDHWPMNKRNCWLCEFKGICSIEKSKREMFLKANFEQRGRWNPLEEREE